MAICQDCKKDMSDPITTTCNDPLVEFPDRTKMQRIPYAEFIQGTKTADRCADCEVEYGGYHHFGCDMEVCPKCDGQLISCGCLEPQPIEEIYICPTCGARHEDGGRGKPPVYCDECGADWKDGTR